MPDELFKLFMDELKKSRANQSRDQSHWENHQHLSDWTDRKGLSNGKKKRSGTEVSPFLYLYIYLYIFRTLTTLEPQGFRFYRVQNVQT